MTLPDLCSRRTDIKEKSSQNTDERQNAAQHGIPSFSKHRRHKKHCCHKNPHKCGDVISPGKQNTDNKRRRRASDVFSWSAILLDRQQQAEKHLKQCEKQYIIHRSVKPIKPLHHRRHPLHHHKGHHTAIRRAFQPPASKLSVKDLMTEKEISSI